MFEARAGVMPSMWLSMYLFCKSAIFEVCGSAMSESLMGWPYWSSSIQIILRESGIKTGGEADDLSILVLDVVIAIDGDKITVRELTFGEQIRHAGALSIVTAALKSCLSGEDDPFRLLDALSAHEKEIFELVSAAAGKPVGWIEALGGEVGERLLLAFWEANKAFFTPPGRLSRWRNGQSPGWGEVFATLIRHGHRSCELMSYTARQIGLYYKEALRAEGREQARAIVATNLGMTGGKEARKAVKDLL
jgi:hypothetical protein